MLGVLTIAEQHLADAHPAENGRDLLKQVRRQAIEMARPALEVMIEQVTGESVVSLHYDLSTLTGEEVVLFTLSRPPAMREVKKK
jgi:uncharacterized protein YbcI